MFFSKDYQSCVSTAIIRLACTKANSYSDFVTQPPSLWRSFVVLCINKVWRVTPYSAVCFATAPKLSALLVSCHLTNLSYICPIQHVRRWGDKKGSANTLALPHGSGAIREACVFVVGIT